MAYQKSVENAKFNVLVDLKKKAEIAQKAGNLAALEKFQAELKDFDESNIFPKSSNFKIYDITVKNAKSKLFTEYSNAIKQYTKAGNIDAAKSLKLELEAISGDDLTLIPQCPFVKDTVWTSESPKICLFVISRNGDKFKARFISQNGSEREVVGSIKGEKISWFSKDVTVVRGDGPGGDNFGTIISQKNGDHKINFIHGSGKVSGSFSLQLQKKK